MTAARLPMVCTADPGIAHLHPCGLRPHDGAHDSLCECGVYRVLWSDRDDGAHVIRTEPVPPKRLACSCGFATARYHTSPDTQRPHW